MSKVLYIAEKPSVAQEFVKALKYETRRYDGYVESGEAVFTWCVGHLVTMSYPDQYDPRLKRWSLDMLPFLPGEFKYEVIPAVRKQFSIVRGLLLREDVDVIYVCTDSGREGEYIYRLVEQMAGVKGKARKRVWIDSQTEEEIRKGIATAKDLSEYDNLSAAAYLRAKEDYLMGINFSRLLTLKYGNCVSAFLKKDRVVLSVGRVMTCVLGMVVRREREIRSFVKTPFYRLVASLACPGGEFEGEWKAVEGSRYFAAKCLYKDNGFLQREKAQELADYLQEHQPVTAKVDAVERKKEKKNPPLLFNLAELQNECAKLFKFSPDETLRIAQELYEKKMVTYPRTDARVLSTAAAKEIGKNLRGLASLPLVSSFAQEILAENRHQALAKTRYVNDKQITDHYALIPTGAGLGNFNRISGSARQVYEIIARRFLAIFYEAAVYQKVNIISDIRGEKFFTGQKSLITEGYLKVMKTSFGREREEQEELLAPAVLNLRKGASLEVRGLEIREGSTTPPKRYHSGSMILAMENAGQLIEDEELRAQIKGSGIGTSATRAEILKKLVNIEYLGIQKKTQVITPTQLGEMVYDVVDASIRQLLNPELTASWEKGLTYVARGEITSDEYMVKLEQFVRSRTAGVMQLNNQYLLRESFKVIAESYAGGRKNLPSA